MSNTKIKAEVMDLLNQIVIKTKGIKGVNTGAEDYNYQPVSLSEMLDDLDSYADPDDHDNTLAKKLKKMTEEEHQELLDQDYLANVNAMCARVVDGDASSAAYNEKQYYNSTC